MKQKIWERLPSKKVNSESVVRNVNNGSQLFSEVTLPFPCVSTGLMWSWRSVWLCWCSCFCSTSSSLVATHPKTSYSLVINAAGRISQLTCDIFPNLEKAMTAVLCSGAESNAHMRVSRTFTHCSVTENMNSQTDFAWYVESCLDGSGSVQSLPRLFWSMTDPNPLQNLYLTFELFFCDRVHEWPWNKGYSYLNALIQDSNPHSLLLHNTVWPLSPLNNSCIQFGHAAVSFN